MDNQKIKKLIRALDRAGALIVGESPLLQTVTTYEPTGEINNEVIMANWHDADGYEHSYHFQEIALSKAEIEGNKITLRDEEGHEVTITLFELVNMDILKEMGQ